MQKSLIDLSRFPGEENISLKISGKFREVFDTALKYLTEVSGHKNTPELRKQIKIMIKTSKNQLNKGT
ncbi:MAG: hypothetical protein IT280_09535 [Ignavibacteria bacterium]|nr:hypothetical protein [Ignavibacteria bacterium]